MGLRTNEHPETSSTKDVISLVVLEVLIPSKQNQGGQDTRPFAKVFFQQAVSTTRLSALLLSPNFSLLTEQWQRLILKLF